jgi:hypothetical protein
MGLPYEVQRYSPGFSPIQTPIRPRLFDSRVRHRNRTLSGHRCLSTGSDAGDDDDVSWSHGAAARVDAL